MAARMRKTHQDDVRKKIQASQLINRLTNHAFGEVELTNTQVKAIEILLKKTLPDLSQIQGIGDGGEFQHVHTVEVQIVDPKA